ncbi:MAG: hypothetical protein Q8M94_06365 [Ignavibacteria bacterium]|nr:hypothetical protein [Ignavibacteria bacterium]
MKTHLITILILTLTEIIIFPQKRNAVISELKNDEVTIKLHKFYEFNDADKKSENKFLVAEITIENISDKSIKMGAEYTMSITVKDASGNEYRSGLKGAGIVSTYLRQYGDEKQDQKAHNLCFSDNFPSKTKARSLLCGFEVPKDVKIDSFGVKKKNLWSTIK